MTKKGRDNLTEVSRNDLVIDTSYMGGTYYVKIFLVELWGDEKVYAVMVMVILTYIYVYIHVNVYQNICVSTIKYPVAFTIYAIVKPFRLFCSGFLHFRMPFAIDRLYVTIQCCRSVHYGYKKWCSGPWFQTDPNLLLRSEVRWLLKRGFGGRYDTNTDHKLLRNYLVLYIWVLILL